MEGYPTILIHYHHGLFWVHKGKAVQRTSLLIFPCQKMGDIIGTGATIMEFLSKTSVLLSVAALSNMLRAFLCFKEFVSWAEGKNSLRHRALSYIPSATQLSTHAVLPLPWIILCLTLGTQGFLFIIYVFILFQFLGLELLIGLHCNWMTLNIDDNCFLFCFFFTGQFMHNFKSQRRPQ